jgi:hypothetical protein
VEITKPNSIPQPSGYSLAGLGGYLRLIGFVGGFMGLGRECTTKLVNVEFKVSFVLMMGY